MRLLLVVLVTLVFFQGGWTKNGSKSPPNIIIIMADDLGSNDVCFRGSNQIPTPNIDALGYQGVILNRHYTPPVCTPSRATLQTGKYPIHTGTQHLVINSNEPWGLPLSEKILPEYLKECAGYKTHMVGKWHLGFAKKDYTPLERGFDSHFGPWGPSLSYFSHRYILPTEPFFDGYDWRRNENVTYEPAGRYATDVLTDEAVNVIRRHKRQDPLFLIVTHLAPHAAEDTDPLQAPKEEIRKFKYIKDPQRRTYAAMVSILDKGIGKIVSALRESDILENSIILFFSDNGAPSRGLYSTTGSNLPLRGQKHSPWEGGTRVPAVIWSPLIEKRHRVSEDPIYSGDWLPTLLSLCKSVPTSKIDGLNVWETISRGKISPRREFVHSIDPIFGYSSYYYNGWKYVNGSTGNGAYDGWLGVVPGADKSPADFSYFDTVVNSSTWKALLPFAQRRLLTADIQMLRKRTEIICLSRKKSKDQNSACDPLKAPCLFHVDSDPCEEFNMASNFTSMVNEMQSRMRVIEAGAVPPGNVPGDPKSDPKLWNGVWTNWLDAKPGKPNLEGK
ncbi:arylsulfatase B [Sergentomyia squamirostris]